VALTGQYISACRKPQGSSRINILIQLQRPRPPLSAGTRACPQWISVNVGSCSLKWNSSCASAVCLVCLLGFTKLVLTCQCLRLWQTLQYHRRCLAHRHASSLTRSTEVREREPYMGLRPFVSPRYPRSLALLCHGQSQSSPGQVEAGEFCGDVWLLEMERASLRLP
jgi:hypothetical protein